MSCMDIGWALVPRGPHTLEGDVLSREYALFCHGQFVSMARGCTSVPNVSGVLGTAAGQSESVRSNALMRCCKDLGVASELWDTDFIAKYKASFAVRTQNSTAYGRSSTKWELKRNMTGSSKGK